MVTLSDAELLQLIDEGESTRVEFKEVLSSSTRDDIREAICAFANDLPGQGLPGVVFTGVRDKDRAIVGIDVTDDVLLQLANMKTEGNIVPPPSIWVEKRTLRSHDVAVVTVLPSDSPPVRCQGKIHIRFGPRRGVATAQDERILNERRRHGDRPFDIRRVQGTSTRDLNLTQFENEYLRQAFAVEVLEANERTLEERLAATKMIASADDPTATVLGVLTLGNNPQEHLPGAYIQFLRISGTELSDDIIDSEEIAGSILDMVRRMDEKLQAHNRTAVDITTYSVEQRTELYPLTALQQITRNAVMHRNYEGTNTPVRVYWFDDRIEVLSPGGPFGTVTPERFAEARETDYRNPNLADAMKTLGLVQRFGVGITTARNQLERSGHPEPTFDVHENNILVTIHAVAKPEWFQGKPSLATVPVLTFFNNKGGVGKTSLIYHLAWMLSEIGHRVLTCDLDPQANLTAAFLEEESVENLWNGNGDQNSQYGATIMDCVRPLMRVGDILSPHLVEITPNLKLIPGDLALAGFEDTLSAEWPNALGSTDLYRPFRILTSFATVMQNGARQMEASIILADVGPNLGAINRSALIATDYVIVPLGADLFSLQGLRNLGPTLLRWRQEWNSRKSHWQNSDFSLPNGGMLPIGYVVQQHSVRLNRPVRAYDMWINRMPREYAYNLLENPRGPYPDTPDQDEQALATVKHYRSLVPMALEARKPVFNLTPSDGAIGSHARAASDARTDFRALAEKIVQIIGLPSNTHR